MTKSELVEGIAKRTGVSKASAKEMFEALLAELNIALCNQEKVQISGFGTFSVVHKPAREGINPLTKKAIKIPAKDVVKFKPAKSFGKED